MNCHLWPNIVFKSVYNLMSKPHRSLLVILVVCVLLVDAFYLRNLSACGNADCIDALLQCSVLPPLCQLVQGFSAPAPPPQKGEEAAWKESHQILQQAAYILYNLW